jgi:hypothetical protein
MNILKIAVEFQRIFFSVVLKNIKVRTWKLDNWSANVCVCGRREAGFVFSRCFPLAVPCHYARTVFYG